MNELPEVLSYSTWVLPVPVVETIVKIEALFGFLDYTGHLTELEDTMSSSDLPTSALSHDIRDAYAKHIHLVAKQFGVYLTDAVSLAKALSIVTALHDLGNPEVTMGLEVEIDDHDVVFTLMNYLIAVSDLTTSDLIDAFEEIEPALVERIKESTDEEAEVDEMHDVAVNRYRKYMSTVTRGHGFESIKNLKTFPYTLEYALLGLNKSYVNTLSPEELTTELAGLILGSTLKPKDLIVDSSDLLMDYLGVVKYVTVQSNLRAILTPYTEEILSE